MYKTELELEKRLNDLAYANVPTDSYENIVIVPRKKQEVALEMSPDEFDLRDLGYEQKMAVISSNAIVNKLGWKPSKIKSDVTKEMIADFQLEQMKNIKQGVYIPSSLDLDLVEDPPEPASAIYGREDVQRIIDEQAVLANAQKETQSSLTNLPEVLEHMKEQWAQRLGANLARADVIYPAGLKRATAKLRIRKAADQELADILGESVLYRAGLEREYTEREAVLSDLSTTLRESEEDKSEYERQLTEVQKENARRRKIYEDQIRLLNSGRNLVAMGENETVDEYKQRLRDIGDSTTNQDAVESAATLLYTDRLREKMGEITRDDVLIGDFIRRLNSDERFSLIKFWDSFKKKVLEIYGQNNQYMSSDDLVGIAEELADQVAIRAAQEPDIFKEAEIVRPLQAFAVQEGIDPAVAGLRGPYVFSKSVKYLPVSRREALKRYVDGERLPVFKKPLGDFNQGLFDKEVGLINTWISAGVGGDSGGAPVRGLRTFEITGISPRRPSPVTGTRRPPPVPVGARASSLDRPPTAGARAQAFTDALPGFADLQLGVQAFADGLADQDEKDRLLALLEVPNRPLLIKRLAIAGLLDAVVAQSGQTGRGLHPKYPKNFPFGVIEISPHKLFYENILKITRKGKHLTGFPNVKVSDAFVRFMFKIIEGGQPTLKEVNTLSAGEKQLFDSVVFTAGLSRDVETTGSGVKQDLKNRIALIEGEIEAGNTNPQLVKEARKILQHLARMKIIGHRAAATHLKQLIQAQRD
jgi:hypothetical protein